MDFPRTVNNSLHFFMSELTSRIVAESGIPADRFHLGKMILQSLKDAPNFLLQIDGGTGQSEISGSVLRRSIQCAISLRKLGLQQNDIMVLMAPNHLDLAIPFYAALYLGIAISAIDKNLGVKELQSTLSITRPKIIFCQSEKAPDVQLTLSKLNIDCHIITFDVGEDFCSFSKFIETHAKENSVDNFKATDFDPETTIGLLISTSGTTGSPKMAAITHVHYSLIGFSFWETFRVFPTPTQMSLLVSPLQWLTAIFNYIISPILRITRLQSSLPITEEHVYHLINTFKPTFAIISPMLITALIKRDARERCDLSSFEMILLGGSAVSKELVNELKIIEPQLEVLNLYGLSEVATLVFGSVSDPVGSSGKPMACFQYRLIDARGNDVYEANVTGELWIKGPCIFKGYYNNPKANRESFTEDGWLKTGDLFYRDENWNFFFVERMKLLLKYKNNQVSPVEVETVIRQNPGVLDVAVTGIPDPEYGDLLVACVVRREGFVVTAQNIKDLVKESLTESKQLRGGVIFISAMPMTPTMKIDRSKLKELVLHVKRE